MVSKIRKLGRPAAKPRPSITAMRRSKKTPRAPSMPRWGGSGGSEAAVSDTGADLALREPRGPQSGGDLRAPPLVRPARAGPARQRCAQRLRVQRLDPEGGH